MGREWRRTNIEGGALTGLVQGIPPAVVGPKAIPDIPAMPTIPAVPAVPDVPDVPEMHNSRRTNRGIDLGGVISSTLLLVLLAFGAGTLFPRHLQQVKAPVRSKPVASGAVGVLTAIAVPVLAGILAMISAVLVIICIGLLGFPIVLLMLLALVVGMVFGWIAIGAWLGEKLFRNPKRSVAVRAALGTMAFTLGIGR